MSAKHSTEHSVLGRLRLGQERNLEKYARMPDRQRRSATRSVWPIVWLLLPWEPACLFSSMALSWFVGCCHRLLRNLTCESCVPLIRVGSATTMLCFGPRGLQLCLIRAFLPSFATRSSCTSKRATQGCMSPNNHRGALLMA